MEDLLTFTGILIIVFSILQIILFFKIWIMTNDVSKIKGKLQCSDSRLWEAKKAYLKGDDELAKEMIMGCLLDDLERYGDSQAGFSSVGDILGKYNTPFKQLGMEIPERIKKLKSYSDITNVIKIW
ncbi:MAG: hypothetical protein KA519_02050 [Bacteroides sp.]|uniref:hypothetical protein n=1 Tax=Bacteroides sp. TaxID=29523 RepID=UPI001B5D5020|nr:hypothetical protein [Bacteroides sp.]MBP6066850.1 hypothetical protein [Bacteroides sp.]MBP9586069.1 hypothetical protein [Bacteroides sp.]